MLALSGVSRSAFYKHFANKAECLAAASEALLEPTLTSLAEVRRRGGGPEAIFEAFIELVCSQPAAARVCFVELHAAGEEGEETADRGFESVARLFEEAIAETPGWEQISPELIRVLLGGLRKMIHTRLYRGEVGELESLGPETWRWLRSVRPPPRPLEAARRQRSGGGPRFEGYTPAERIARAVAGLVAEKGYGAMSTDDIAARAAISLSTFYEHFTDKRDAVLGALEMSGAQIMALAVPAARRAGNWQDGVRALYEAMCAYFIAEPAMAHLAMVGVYGAGPRALARRDRVIDSLTAMTGARLRCEPRGARGERGGDRGDRLRADARAGAQQGRGEPGRNRAARHLHHPGRVRRTRAGLRGGKRRGPAALRGAGGEEAVAQPERSGGGGMRSSSSAASAPR